MSTILLCTQGTLGDLHPMIGIGRILKERGHRVRLATSPRYAEKIRQEGLESAPVGPSIDPTARELVERVMHPRRGSEYMMRELIIPHLRACLRDTREAAEDADLLVSTPITPAVRLVAESIDRPWASVVFSPLSFWSRRDPPAVPPLMELVDVPWIGPLLTRAVMSGDRWLSRLWFTEYEKLREELGVERSGHPMLEGQHSPHLVLALFSRELAARNADWPDPAIQTGFVFYDRGESEAAETLAAFLAAGEPPVVVTLGSIGSMTDRARDVFESAVEVAHRRAERFLLITGPRYDGMLRGRGAERVLSLAYAPYSEVFPRAKLIVHQGGSGTTGQALRSGRPMVVVPFAHDQFEHARLLERRGVALRLASTSFTADRLEKALDRLENESSFRDAAREAAQTVGGEPGAAGAADALEELCKETERTGAGVDRS